MNCAHCTQIDQQIGALFGTLREEGILDNTVMMFTSDHGEAMGNHGIRAKQNFYDASANVPLILMGTKGDARVQAGQVEQMKSCLVEVLRGPDRDWVTDGRRTGLPNRRYRHAPNRGLGMTRGHQWSVPPVNPGGLMNFFPETPEDT